MTSGTSSFNRTFCRASLILLQAIVLAPATLANPQDGRVAAGSASIDQTSGSRLDVNQHSDRAVIDWRSFDIRSHEHTNFRQPSASAIALNRVQGSGSSLIDGRLTANGQVFLVNQNGVLFGKNARVDVAGLVATTADINNEDFMNGHYRFDKPSANPDAQVANKGQIQVQDGGAVVLAAPRVSNEGLIAARLGNVALAGAKTFTLDFHGDGLLQFDAGSEIAEQSSASQSESDALVSNSGTIVADGGIVAMSARAADGVVDRVINMDGVVQARAVALEGGKIILSGGDEGIVAVSGKLDASGLETGQKGGTVKVLGEKVGLFEGAKIDTSGDAGGGDVLIGGNYKGQGPEPNAKRAFVAKDAGIKADATSDGDGGKVIVWSDEATWFRGDINARGGENGGDGGFVEVSGKDNLQFDGSVTTLAPMGQTGTLLLDPTNIRIDASEPDGSLDQVDEFDDPDLDAIGTLTFTRIQNTTINSAQTNVILQATNDIDFFAPISMANSGVGITAQAGNDIVLGINADITTNGGDLRFEADSPAIPGGNNGVGQISFLFDGVGPGVSTNGGDITLIASNIEQAGGVNADPIDSGGGDISITATSASDNIISLNSLSSGTGDITLTANEINIGAPSGSGELIFQPFTASLDIVVGGPSDTDIPALELGSVGFATTDGFSSITVGRSDGTGTITVDPAGVTFNDSVTLRSPGEGGEIVLNGTITTTGGSDFSVIGNTLLGSDSSVSTGGGGITFNGLIDSAVDEGDPAVLTLDAVAGAIALHGDVGSIGPLGGLTATGGSISLQDVTTTGDQSYTGALTFNSSYSTNGGDFSVIGDTLLGSDSSVSTGGGGITFNGLIDSEVFEEDGPFGLTLDAVAGTIALLGNVGSRSPLARLTATGGSIGLQDVTTTDDQSYAGAVTFDSSYSTNGGDFSVIGNTLLGSDSSVSTEGGAITFNGLIDSAVDEGDPAVLTLNAVDGAIALLGNVGSRSALARLTATGGRIRLQDVTTSGLQRYSGSVTLNSTYVTDGGAFVVDGDAFLGSPTTVRTAGEQIEFGGRLNGSNPLSLFADAGDILFRRDVGTLARLGAVSIGSADDILIGGRFFAGDTSFRYSGNATSPVDSLNLRSLFLLSSAQGATLFGTVGGASGEDAALVVQGPFDDPDFTINNCVIGVACGPPVVEPVVPEPLQLPAEPIPPVGLFGSTPSPTEGRTLWAIYKRRAPSEDSAGKTQVSYDNIPPVYKRHPPSEDPTEPQYSNFGNEELWD